VLNDRNRLCFFVLILFLLHDRPSSVLTLFDMQTRFSTLGTVHYENSFEATSPGRQFEIDMRGGEALYLPAGWLHDIESSGIYQSITLWMYQDQEHFDTLKGH